MDARKFEELFSQWYTPLCRFSFRMLADRESAEDVVQEVFIRFWNQRDRVNDTFQVKSYLFRAVYNASLNQRSALQKETSSDPGVWDSVEAGDSSDQGITTSELQEAVDQGMKLLPPACRSVFLLSRDEEMSYKEIADTLAISLKTVEAQMSKALRILRQHLAPFLMICLALWKTFLEKF